MPTRDDELVTLAVLNTEIEAQLLVNLLNESGIAAVATGGFTSSFRAEAPGDVRVLTKNDCFLRARSVLSEYEQARETTSKEEDLLPENYESSLKRFAVWSWLVLEFVGILGTVLFWAAGESSAAASAMGLVISVAFIWLIVAWLRRQS